jgi:hypothetical protein
MVEPRKLTVAIDFDNTFSADPELFRTFVALLKARGHTPIMVTGRPEKHGLDEAPKALAGDLMPIIFADGEWKINAARAKGYEVDIWIDDNPTYIRPPYTFRETVRELKKLNHLDAITRGE